MLNARLFAILIFVVEVAAQILQPGADQAQTATPPAAPATSPALTIPPNPANTLLSIWSAKDWELNADPKSPEWSGVTGVTAARDQFGEIVKLNATEVRSRWSRRHLYLLFICPYDTLNLKPEPVTTKETDKLWDWDVVAAFIGVDYLNPSKYKEFQMSPQGEYVDLDVDRDNAEKQKGIEWDSGMVVKGRVDVVSKTWYGEMRIPFNTLEVKHPKAGDELRIGLFRIDGVEPKRVRLSWRPTNATTFHVPESFGSVILTREAEKPEKH